MSEEDKQKFSDDQFERRLNRVWMIVQLSVAVYVIHVFGGFIMPLTGASPEMMDMWANASQEVAAMSIATVTSYITGSALAYRK